MGKFCILRHLQAILVKAPFINGLSFFYVEFRLQLKTEKKTKIPFSTPISVFSNDVIYASQNLLRSNALFHIPKVIIQVQCGNGVLNRLVSFVKCMELAC